jgi:DnaJ-class molecular chaperone
MTNEIPELEMVCQRCGGTGQRAEVGSDDGYVDCFDCHGTGYKPTPIGVRILELVRHNSRVSVTAELRVPSAR